MKIDLTPTNLIDQLRAWFHPKDRSVVMADDCFIEGDEISTPDNPRIGRRRLYAKSGCWYDLDSGGTETSLCSSGVDPNTHSHSHLVASDADPTDVLSADTSGNITHPYNITMSGAGKSINGTGSNFPALGTTTLAEKFGHIYLGTAKDEFPYDDNWGMSDRRLNAKTTTLVDDFTGAALGGSWAWAAYGGMVTPSGISVAKSSVSIGFGAAQSNVKAFLYQAVTFTSQSTYNVFFGTRFFALNQFCGIRVDDNSDNNYLEAYFRWNSGTPIWECVSSFRTGGGAVTTTLHRSPDILSERFLAAIQVSGTFWTSVNLLAQYATGLSHSGIDQFTVAAAQNWGAPAQINVGIIQLNPVATPATFQAGVVDAITKG